MSFAVTFDKPVVVSAEHLGAFLALAGVPANVHPLDPETRYFRPSDEPTAQDESAPAAAPAAEGKRRGRPAKVKGEDPAAGSEPEAAASEQATTPASAPEELQVRFTNLVAKDYDKALEVLGNFGVSRFTELKPEQHAAIADVLTHFGV
jgi:hypothetical protein